MFYSRKLVYILDVFFTDVLSDSQNAKCLKCDYIYRLDIVQEQHDNCCPNCGTTVLNSTRNFSREQNYKPYLKGTNDDRRSQGSTTY